MKGMKTIYFTTMIVLMTIQSYSQEKSLISGDYTGISFTQFATDIEKKSDYQFFFNPSWIDSLNVTISIRNKPIEEILEKIFLGTIYHYAIDQNQYVYITQREAILTDLSEEFFYGGGSGPDSVRKNIDNSRFENATKAKVDKLVTIGTRGANSKTSACIAGYVRNAATGEPVIGATVLIEKPITGVITDGNGYYSITLSKGTHQLLIRSLGMKSAARNILLHADGNLTIELEEDVLPLKAVIVEADRDERVFGLQMGLEKIDLKTLKQIPVVLGEVDVLKAVLTLPGVQSVGEGTVGFNVRGGATDQNLILFNDAAIYNPSHLFGFFSAINPDLLKNAELYKSGIPAEYGGRISSVLDITTRDGNKKKWAGSGGISPITGRLAIEGPLVKDKSSILLGGRATYSDWLLREIPSASLNKSEASFYDFNLLVSHEINAKNSVYVSGYLSRDHFKFQSDTAYRYNNRIVSAKWRHIFDNKFFGELSTNFSGYEYTISSEKNPVNAFDLSYSIQQVQTKADFSYFLNAKHTLTSGAGLIQYNLKPGTMTPTGNESLIIPDRVPRERAVESAIYIGDSFEVNRRLSLYGGIRYSYFQNIGPRNIFQYQPGVPKDASTIIDTVSVASGKKVSASGGPELRLSARYSLSPTTSIKVSYNRMRQYIQMLSNTTAIAPTDIWKLSDPYVKPLLGDQISLGYYNNLRSSTIETSVETYVKFMQNALDFKGGAELLLNHHIETDVLNAEGKAYGIEFMIKKTRGKLNGWLSYTYSRSWLRTKGLSEVETINRGEYYPSNYDKPHAVNFIGNYKFNRRFSTSVNLVYGTGRPITLPIAKYTLEGNERLLYSDRNQYRIPDYFRADLSLFIEGNHKVHKPAHGFWSLSVYNITGRRNAYSVYFTSENGVVKGYKLSIFGNAIPTVTYNFRF